MIPTGGAILTPTQYGAKVPPMTHWPINDHGRSGLYYVNRIYPTIQGEGGQAGTPMTIVRLQGCPVGCVWCDTPESWKPESHWSVMTARTVGRIVASYPPYWALVTGGEPCWHDLCELTDLLGYHGLKRALETSGVFPITGDWEWVCVSPKPAGRLPLDISTLDRATEIKWIVGRTEDVAAFSQFVNTYHIWSKRLSIQPVSCSPKATKLCLDALMDHPSWKLSLQTHKLLNIA